LKALHISGIKSSLESILDQLQHIQAGSGPGIPFAQGFDEELVTPRQGTRVGKRGWDLLQFLEADKDLINCSNETRIKLVEGYGGLIN
jgi:hypothetical protein